MGGKRERKKMKIIVREKIRARDGEKREQERLRVLFR